MIIRLGGLLLLFALSLAIYGLLFRVAGRLPFLSWMGRLPGDVRIEGPRTCFCFPFTTGLVISVALLTLLRVVRFLLPRW